jgi:hypothetical protein
MGGFKNGIKNDRKIILKEVIMSSVNRSTTMTPQQIAKSAIREVKAAMNTRFTRGNLEKGISYIQVNQTGRIKVGKFIESGYIGSGDGMELVLIFELYGKKHIVKEEVWGSVQGTELSYFEKEF